MIKDKSKNIFSWPLIGNQPVVDFLTRSLKNKKLAQTYIFTGPDDVGKMTIARCFAKNLMLLDLGERADIVNMSLERLDLSGDFHVIEREEGKKNIAIAQIRDLIKILEMSSFNNSYKIGVVKEAEKLSEEAMNALLKILEEPEKKVVIILLTSHLENILPTIISRSQIINFYQVKTDVIHDYLIKHNDLSPSLAKNLSRLALGRPALAVKFLQEPDFYEDYLKRAGAGFNFLNKNIGERLNLIPELLGSDKTGQEGVKKTLYSLSIWEGVVRDLMLLKLGQPDLIQHESLRQDLNKITEKFSMIELSQKFSWFNLSREYLAANVSPKNVLENLAINF